MHAVYLADNSDGNDILNNSIDLCTGDPIKIKNGSDSNDVIGNYANRSGDKAFVNATNSGGSNSTSITVDDNIATFPHPGATNNPIVSCYESDVDDCDGFTFTNNFFEFAKPANSDEEIVAIVGGDFDADGADEILVAFNYGGPSGFAKVVSTAGSTDNRYLHTVLYVNDNWNVDAMTAGDFDSDGDEEILTAVYSSGGTARVYKGDGKTYKSGCTASYIYSSSSWRITGMAAGNYNGSGGDEVITALEDADDTAIYSGNGTTSVTNNGVLLQDPPLWRITAMTSGDFSDDGDHEIITAMNHSGNTYKIYSGNGTSSVANTALHTDTTSPYWQTTATVGGDFDDDGVDELITGMYFEGATSAYRLYIGNGTSSVANSTLASDDSAPGFYIRALGAADYDDDAALDLVTAIDDGVNKIVVGNGDTDYDDILSSLYTESSW